MAKVTMRMIAQAAKVSPTTVSHVLNETSGTFIAPQTRKKVLNTAAKLGYQKSLLSRSIKKSLHHLGIATGNRNILSLDATAVIFDAFRQEALAKNYLTVDLPISDGVGVMTPQAVIRKMRDLYQTKLIDGYLVDKQNFNNAAIEQLVNWDVPMVLVNGEPYGLGKNKPVLAPSIIIDTFDAAGKAVEYLTGLGHERIAMITRPYDRIEKSMHPYQVSRLRKGFYAAMEKANLPYTTSDVVDGEPEDREKTQQAAETLMSRKIPPTAIIVGDDAIALVVIQQLVAMGQSVPQDVSVVTCGGWSSVMRLSPVEMTAMRAALVENGRLAAGMLIDMLEGRAVAKDVTLLPSELIAGRTTGPVKTK